MLRLIFFNPQKDSIKNRNGKSRMNFACIYVYNPVLIPKSNETFNKPANNFYIVLLFS